MYPSLFIFGLGYVGRTFKERMVASRWHVCGTHRGIADGEKGLFSYEAGRPVPSSILDRFDAFLITIPPTAEGDPVFLDHEAYFQKRGMESLWIGYCSTTGVYGDTNGAWVDEFSPLLTTQERSLRRIKAERQWLSLYPQTYIFRLGGIYGPGRSALDEIMKDGAVAIDKKDHVFSRIHVEDIVRIFETALLSPSKAGIYNLVDDKPSSTAEVMIYASALIGASPPTLIPYERACLSPQKASFYRECRRVKNQRLKDNLGVTLLYPTYREGLRAIADTLAVKTREFKASERLK